MQNRDVKKSFSYNNLHSLLTYVYFCSIIIATKMKHYYSLIFELKQEVLKLAGKKLIIPSKKYKGDTSVVSARLPNEMIKDLDTIAESTGRNRNDYDVSGIRY